MKRILIIEDNKFMRLILKAHLTEAGFEVDAVEDGLIGIEAFSAKYYDLILTDINMPNCNGLDLIPYIKEKMHSKQKLFVISASSDSNNVSQALLLGADLFIAKNFLQTSLVNNVKNALKTNWYL